MEHCRWSGILTPEQLQQQLDAHQVDFANQEGEFWTPLLVLWVWILQCCSKEKSCAAAVLRGIGLLIAAGDQAHASNTGAYCKARAKLPEAFLRDLALQVGWQLEEQAASAWRPNGKRLFVIDGSTITLEDTEANQAVYPQQGGQKKGLGYPLIRIVVIFSLATGAVLAVAWAPYHGKQTSELALLRRLWDVFEPGDIVLADRFFANYWIFVLARRKKLELLFFAHQKRKIDFRAGVSLGKRDHRVIWDLPARPDWMDAELYESLRAEVSENPLEVRELEVNVSKPGFRTKKLLLATTLIDAEEYPKDTLANWYRRRWQAELDLRSLTAMMQMDHLRSNSLRPKRKCHSGLTP